MMKSLFMLLLTSIVTVACASTAPLKKEPQQTSPQIEQEYRAAEALAKNGEAKKALARLKKFVQTNPESDKAASAHLLMGQLYQNSQQPTEALSQYLAIVNSSVASPLEGEAILRAAKIQLRLNQPTEAEKTLGRLETLKGLSPEQWAEGEKAKYESFAAQKKYVLALKSAVRLAEKHPQPAERDKYRSLAIESIDGRLNEDELYQIGKDSEYSFVRANAQFRYGVLKAEQRDYSEARNALESVAKLAPGSELAARAERLVTQINARFRVNPRTIGVILPLTGKQSGIGYKALRGIQLGLGIHGSGKKSSDLRLAIIDSEGSPEMARRAVERLVIEDSVIAIIGGLLSKTAQAEAQKAQELGVPALMLSQKSGLTQTGDFVFRNSLTSQMQIQKLVNTAMDQMGMRRFAILYPNDAYGVEFANLFWDEVLKRGGEIRGAQPFDPQETDFRGHVQRLVGTFYFEDRADEHRLYSRAWAEKNPKKSARQTAPSLEELLPPVVDFDAIFIPDGAKAVGQIAPMLAYNNVNGVRLIGTNIWNSPALISRGQKFVEGSIFVDSYLTTDASFLSGDFYTRFKATFDEEPSLTEVQAYDSALILRHLINSGASSRLGLRNNLAELENFNGAIGPLSVTPNREFLRPLTALTVKDGRILELESTRR